MPTLRPRPLESGEIFLMAINGARFDSSATKTESADRFGRAWPHRQEPMQRRFQMRPSTDLRERRLHVGLQRRDEAGDLEIEARHRRHLARLREQPHPADA